MFGSEGDIHGDLMFGKSGGMGACLEETDTIQHASDILYGGISISQSMTEIVLPLAIFGVLEDREDDVLL